MSIESSIRTKLATLTPSELVVVNESSLHRTAPGAETHFKVVIVSEIFKGLNRVERHQKIYGLLSQERDQGLHALALWTFTEIEWNARSDKLELASPECAHSPKRGSGLPTL